MRISDWSSDVCSSDLFFAQNCELADEAYPGDIIGIPNHGTLRVGDTLSEKADVRFTGLPNFAPEILRRVALKDPTKTKQLRKALDDLSEEGVIQVRSEEHTSELQSLMRISYAVFCLTQKNTYTKKQLHTQTNANIQENKK